MFCKNCGKEIQNGAAFCNSCGVPVQQSNTPPSPQQAYAPHPPAATAYQQPQKPKKKHGFLKALAVTVSVLTVFVVSLGFVFPGLLWPRSLGIKTSQEAYQSAMNKMGYQKDSAPKSGAAGDYLYTYRGSHSVDITLTSEELTSFFNYNRPDYYALKNVQIRINKDGTIEACGQIDVDYVFSTILENRYSREDAKGAMPMLGLLPDDVNLYVKLDGGIQNNTLRSLDELEVSVMGIPIPGSMINTSSTLNFITDTANSSLQKAADKTGGSYELLEAKDGMLRYVGTLPDSLTRTSAQ